MWISSKCARVNEKKMPRHVRTLRTDARSFNWSRTNAPRVGRNAWVGRKTCWTQCVCWTAHGNVTGTYIWHDGTTFICKITTTRWSAGESNSHQSFFILGCGWRMEDTNINWYEFYIAYNVL